MAGKSKIVVIMGSPSDEEKMKPVFETLCAYNQYLVDNSADHSMEQPDSLIIEAHCISAHRNRRDLVFVIQSLNAEWEKYNQGNQGIVPTDAIIAGAGMAAALPGDIAAQTIIPVIGLPLSDSKLDGVDALYSIVQMPSGIPVATVAIDGAKNAAFLALQIAAACNPSIFDYLRAVRRSMRQNNINSEEMINHKYSVH